MKKIQLILFVSVSIIWASCGSTTGSQATPEVGQTFRYMSKVKTDADMQGISVESDMEYYYTLEVQKKTDTGTVYSMKYDSMKMDMVNPMMGSLSYNSNDSTPTDNPILDQVHKTFEELGSAEISVWVDQRGNVVKSEGFEEVSSGAGGMLGGGSMSADMGAKMSFVGLPDEKIVKGLSFSEKTNAGGLAFSVTTNYTVAAVSEDEITLNIELEPVSGKELDLGNIKANIENLKGNGNAVVSKYTGLVRQRKLEQESTMQMDVQGQVMEMTNKTVSTITLLD